MLTLPVCLNNRSSFFVPALAVVVIAIILFLLFLYHIHHHDVKKATVKGVFCVFGMIEHSLAFLTPLTVIELLKNLTISRCLDSPSKISMI
jgi:peptidoglycan biosynthesis protein MviN/MurJ (putative lipid II flippase)